MSTALGLAMQISANTAQLAQAVQDVNAKLDSMGAAGKKAADDLGTLKNIEIAKLALGGIKAASSAFISLSKSVIGAAESVIRFGKQVADELDALNDVANRTGVGVEALQAYGAAAKLAGTDVETFARSIQKLTVNIGNAVGDENAQKKFKELGLSFDELRQKTPTEQFEAVADAIARIADPAERAAAAVSVFGKGGIELGPLFSEGPGALANMRKEAEALGQVVSADAVQSIADMNDAFDKVWMTVKGLTAQIVGELAEPVRQIAEDLLEVVKEVGATNIAQDVAAGLLDFIKMAGNAFFQLAQFIEAFVKKFGPTLGLDLRSETEKRIEELRAGQIQRGEVDPTGGFAGAPNANTPEAKAAAAQIARLEAQLAAEAGSSMLETMQTNFNSAVDTASSRLEARMRSATPPQPSVPTPQVDAATQEQNDQQLEELRGLRRDIRNTTVEIAG